MLSVSLSFQSASFGQVYRHGFTNSDTDLPGLKSERIISSSWSAPVGTLSFPTASGNVLLGNKGYLHKYKLTLALQNLYQLEITSISMDKLSGDDADFQLKVNGENYTGTFPSTSTLTGTTRTKTVSNLRGQVEIEIVVTNTNVAANNYSRIDDFVINGSFTSYELPGPDANGILYVKSQSSSGLGSSWAKALNQVHDALTIARNNSAVKQIWIQTGRFGAKNDQQALSLVNGVKMYGGFNGNEITLSDRNLTAATLTTLFGRRNSVLANTGLDNTTVLDGFEIREGTGTALTSMRVGGGMYNLNASPVIRNCIFTNNTLKGNASYEGAGMYNVNSNPVITQCLFTFNRVEDAYGELIDGASGITNRNSAPVITNCTFTRNFGTAMHNQGNSSPVIRNTIIWSNTDFEFLPSNEIGIFNDPDLSGHPIVTYSLIGGGYQDGDHIINADPELTRGDAAPYHAKLYFNSPAIGAGDPATDLNLFVSAEGSAPKDLDNKNRILDGRIELGVFEIKGPDTWRVLASSTAANPDGRSWESAFPTLQQALAVAIPRDQIWVGKGEYVATAGQSFHIPQDVSVYGGFKGIETVLSQRPFPAPRGIVPEASILKGNGASVVSDAEQEKQTYFLLDGLTITGGQAVNGGGLYLVNSSPKIVNCSIVGNKASQKGGGIYWAALAINYLDPFTFKTTLVSKNTAATGGGVYSVEGTYFLMSHCVLSENTASTSGGAVAGYAVFLINATVVKNTAPAGGAVEVMAGGLCSIVNSIISRNSSGIIGTSDDAQYPPVTASIVQGFTENINSFRLDGDTDPMFTDFNGSDFSLTACSPAINRGYNYPGAFVPHDFAGNPSEYNKSPDMGAFEFQRTPQPVNLPAGNKVMTAFVFRGVTPILKDCEMVALIEPTVADSLFGAFEVKNYVASGQTLMEGGGVFVRRHIDISPTAVSYGSTANVTLLFTRAEFDDYNAAYGNSHNASLPANLKVIQYHGTSATGLPGGYSGGMKIITNPEVSLTADGQFYMVKFPITGLSGFFVTGKVTLHYR